MTAVLQQDSRQALRVARQAGCPPGRSGIVDIRFPYGPDGCAQGAAEHAHDRSGLERWRSGGVVLAGAGHDRAASAGRRLAQPPAFEAAAEARRYWADVLPAPASGVAAVRWWATYAEARRASAR